MFTKGKWVRLPGLHDDHVHIVLHTIVVVDEYTVMGKECCMAFIQGGVRTKIAMRADDLIKMIDEDYDNRMKEIIK